jgi:hypothetical protein
VRQSERTATYDVSRASTISDLLQPGDSAQSGAQSLTYDKAGVVSFTLAPGSRVEVVSNEGRDETPGQLTVALVRGSIHAEVTPQPRGEVFAVEVGQTRVAVHGTSFTVSREGDQAIVEVTHGSVAVGPAGHPGSTQGWLLVGPERGSFSLDGARVARWLGPPLPAPLPKTLGSVSASPPGAYEPLARNSSSPSSLSQKPAVAMGSPVPSQRAAPSSASGASESAEQAAPPGEETPSTGNRPTVDGRSRADQQQAATAAILKDLEACYERQVSSFGVTFSIRSSLTLTILPSGAVREAVFDPPLSPTLMSCAREAVASARFPRGDANTEVRVPLQLSPP